MANFEAFRQGISSSINLLFLRSGKKANTMATVPAAMVSPPTSILLVEQRNDWRWYCSTVVEDRYIYWTNNKLFSLDKASNCPKIQQGSMTTVHNGGKNQLEKLQVLYMALLYTTYPVSIVDFYTLVILNHTLIGQRIKTCHFQNSLCPQSALSIICTTYVEEQFSIVSLNRIK